MDKKGKYQELGDLFKAVFDIAKNPQLIKDYMNGKFRGKLFIHDDVGVKDELEHGLFNLEKEVFIIEDKKTGERKEIPFTEKQKELYRKVYG